MGLPQKETVSAKSEKRRSELRRMQAKYQYAYEYANTIATVKTLPWRERPGPLYWLRLSMNLLWLVPNLPNITVTVLRYLVGRGLERYRDYVFYPLAPQPDPDLVNNFQDDKIFGLQRVMGVNPVVLRAVTEQQRLPENLSEHEIQRVFAEQVEDLDYATAIAQKRLYVLDYPVLEILRKNPGTIDGGRKQHTAAPIVVLFMRPDGILRPIAIQLHQKPGTDNPIYTPKDGNLWLMAKTFAQIADGNHHILYTHATRIHYVMEAIIMASRRQLYRRHPLHVLLDPHLQYTLNVNHQHTFLKNRKGRPGRFGELFAGDYEATLQCMADAMTSFNFKTSAFPNDIAERQVDNPRLFYPYRDDGILLWNAIQGFAKEYVALYYQSNRDVIEDNELQAWAHDISAHDRGRIRGFPGRMESVGELSETLGHILFICTAHHSSIHFHQYRYPGFVPNMPYSGYGPPPSGKASQPDAAELMAIQPAFRAANSQTWTFFLTNFRVNRIGQYKPRRFDPEARAVIQRYRDELEGIAAQIDRANRTRPVSYDLMNPRRIPNGVTV